ncbi:hypothetical protein EI94DRAFT_1698343 [Lactarius quietus]|nr:hypothetical protein EI94DRAFT_1698343 [Lactarius quietus]
MTKAIEDILSSIPESRESIQNPSTLSLPITPLPSYMGPPKPPLPLNPHCPVCLRTSSPSNPPLLCFRNKTLENAPSATVTRAKEKTHAPLYSSATASPPRPSLVVGLDSLNWNKGRPSPAAICSSINHLLEASGNDQVCISATWWTARDNMILTGGPNTSAHHLQQAAPIISQHFGDTYPPFPPTIRPNVKWSKLLINNVPTGVTSEDRAKTLEECHATLVSDNPSYAFLNITQKPSWVHDPSSYPEGAVSLLVVAFKDPDGSLACGPDEEGTLRVWTLRHHTKMEAMSNTCNPPF